MATIIPDIANGFKIIGERQFYRFYRFYRFLAAGGKPDRSFLAWYTPDLQGNESDFILYSDSVGLIVFKVEDWGLEQVREANSNQFGERVKV